MKIKYIEAEGSVEIKDGLRSHYLALKVLCVLNVLMAGLNLYDGVEKGFRSPELIWGIIGLASLITLYIFLFKRSTDEKIQIDQIERVKEKSVFGSKRFSIQLKNGKLRSLIRVGSQVEIDKLKAMLTE